ncbi:hypothetical protein DMENIID0001_019540 [Sergentomyia squamirostris]
MGDQEEDEECVEAESIVSKWGLSPAGVGRLRHCGIFSGDHLRMIDSHTISRIFNEDSFLGDSLIFRMQLESWRKSNGVSERNSGSGTMFPDLVASDNDNSILKSASLESILNKSLKGKSILNDFQRNKILSSGNQNDLVQIIVEGHLLHDRKLGKQCGMEYAGKIVELFPSEKVETYYVPADSKAGVKSLKNPRGKIAAKKRNTIARYSSVFKKIRRDTDPELAVDQEERPSYDEDFTGIVEASTNWLQQNSEPWEEVISNWKISAASRIEGNAFMDINAILEAWTQYKDDQGFALIAIDVKVKYSFEDSDFGSKFDELRQPLLSILEMEIKDKTTRKLLQKINQPDAKRDSQDFLLILCLNAFLKPIRQSKSKLISIKEAQRSMVVFCTSEDEVEEEKKQVGLSNDTPVLVVLGDDSTNLTKFMIDFECLKYDLPSMEVAIKVFIEVSLLFEKAFCSKCSLAWQFLQAFCFPMNREYDSQIINLIERIQTIKSSE